jgi:hypothetical protein
MNGLARCSVHDVMVIAVAEAAIPKDSAMRAASFTGFMMFGFFD